MKKFILPKYAIKELYRANDYAEKSTAAMKRFEQWLEQTLGDEYDFFDLMETLTASKDRRYEDIRGCSEELTEISYGNGVNVEALEQAINDWLIKQKGRGCSLK